MSISAQQTARIIKVLSEIAAEQCTLDDAAIVREPDSEMRTILLGLLLLAEDLSYGKHLHEKAEEARNKSDAERESLLQDLQAALSARDQFLAVASHELRTPLTTLTLLAQSLGQAVTGGAAALDLLAARLPLLHRQVSRLNTLVSEMLDVSRITTGRLELRAAPMDLVSLVREVANRFVLDPVGGKTPVELRHPQAVLGVWDCSRVDQVLTNLISNAIKYGGGKPIHVSVHEGRSEVWVYVQDQGIGIAAPEQAKLFMPFARAHSADNFGGLGLGLWISRQIVEASGGTIGVKSRLHEGALFTVTLPRNPVPAELP